MKKPRIRPYENVDWPAVCRVHDAARGQELALGGVDARAFLPMKEVARRDEFFDSETLIACEADRVVGLVSCDSEQRDPAPSVPASSPLRLRVGRG